MKKILITITISLISALSFAGTVKVRSGDLYQGEEQVNENSTGRTCYVYLDRIEQNPVGKHCYKITARPKFFTDRESHPQDEIVTMSRITNAHRPEYPQFKTCASSLDGKTSGNDIYGDDESVIYTQFFAWAGDFDGNQFDFFITISPETKQPSRIRLHKLNWFSETNYDCVNLQKM